MWPHHIGKNDELETDGVAAAHRDEKNTIKQLILTWKTSRHFIFLRNKDYIQIYVNENSTMYKIVKVYSQEQKSSSELFAPPSLYLAKKIEINSKGNTFSEQ